jgi:dTDP-4-amino-4,6-dideoxygalactose transaminase
MQIHLNDLKRQHSLLKIEIDAAISTVIEKCQFIGGEIVSDFENEFATYNRAKYCIGCANGTDALEIALHALDLQQGDEVLVPSITWISTAGAVRNMGGIPVFVDVDDNSLIDLDDVKTKTTAKTKGIIPVHLFGLPVDMNALLSIANKHKLFIIEDCAQAHGAEINGQKVGTFGDIGTFSFYPGKNLGAFGDAGGLITNSDELDEKCRMIRNHGQKKKFEFLSVGRNSRLDTLQAAILSVKLKHLDNWTTKRIEVAAKYKSLLSDLPLTLPPVSTGLKHVYHLFVIQSENRNKLKKYLEEKGIQTAIHYPAALPSTDTFSDNSSNTFSQAEHFTKRCLSIPIFPEITDDEIEYVCDAIHSFYK